MSAAVQYTELCNRKIESTFAHVHNADELHKTYKHNHIISNLVKIYNALHIVGQGTQYFTNNAKAGTHCSETTHVATGIFTASNHRVF